MKLKIALCIVTITLLGGIYAACDSGSGTAGDYLELGYNVDGGQAIITSSGTVAVTHGLGVTPTSVVITDAAPSSGSGNYYTVTSIGATKFTITGYDLKDTTDGGVTILTSGTVSWLAIE